MFSKYYFPALFSRSYYPGGVAPVAWAGDFTEQGITGYNAFVDGADLFISWTVDPTFNPPGTFYQIYINNQLKWSGDRTRATVPGLHETNSQMVIHVGRVTEKNRNINYSSRLLPVAGTGNRAQLTWVGGLWIDNDLSYFNIYMSDGPDQPVNLSGPVATLPAAVGGLYGGGFGRGRFGRGPFGRSMVSYQWTSGALQTGAWQFAVGSVDAAGNLSQDPPVVTLNIIGPPAAPAWIAGRRIWLAAYDSATRMATLNWNESSWQ